MFCILNFLFKFRVILIVFLISSCSPPALTPTPLPSSQTSTSTGISAPTAIPQVTPLQTDSSVSPMEILNPLTGLPVKDPSLLQYPALLVSISHFPVEARPQAGLSFAPYVFEIYITEGATRFLTTFYGEFPAPEVPITGSCEIRREPFRQVN